MIYYLFVIYMIILMLIMLNLSMYFLGKKFFIYLEYELMNFNSVKFEGLILIDWMSLMFVSVVLLISSMVIFYSIEYMDNHKNIKRFMNLVMLFVLSMMFMIMSPNMISILLGWDGLGLISFCLILFYQNMDSYNSGMVTVLMNRIGDIMIMMLIGLLITKGSWNFMNLNNVSSLMMFLIIITSFTKSAQIPFSSWLPKAMAAPTPVSSLVHSSTLVTAGVYLLIRFNFLMVDSIYFMNWILMISVLTMFLSGLGANFEYDLKKIIALSTLSQLGVMMFSLSMGLFKISYFHLLSHAMFKSMLFMSAGVIIHNMLGNQDIRFLSMILFQMPIVSLIFVCSSYSLCGIPFLSGFFSKDLILEMFLMSNYNKMILMMLFISMGLTVTYSFRLIYYSFVKFSNLNIYMEVKNLMSLMIFSMMILFLMTIIIGLILSWLLFSMKNFIYLTKSFKLMIFGCMFLGCVIGGLISKIYLNWILYMMELFYFFYYMWFVMMLINFKKNKMFIYMVMLVKNIDNGWNEYINGVSIFNFFKKIFLMDFFNKNYFYLLILIMYLTILLFFF